MRNRLKQLAKGKFEHEFPEIHFSNDSLSITVLEGEDYSGSFWLKSQNGIKIRGVCYSTNNRMECMTPQFEGEEVRIRYQLHSKGLVEQEVQKGEFVIVCNRFEYSLPFVATISKHYMESSNGLIKNLEEFTELAKSHWDEAYQIFYHKSFDEIIPRENSRAQLLYRGMISSKPGNGNMEEFLVGTGAKEKVSFQCNQDAFVMKTPREILKESFEIEKNTWGYTEIQISSDSPFIDIPKRKVTSNDFIGSTCGIDFFILPKQLHAGNNFGTIELSNVYQTVKIPVTLLAGTDSNIKNQRKKRRDIKEDQVSILELYQAYRLKRLSTGVWANETIEILNHLHTLVPDEPMYLLMKAQALLINRQRQDCEWILEDFKRAWTDRTSPVWGYYLYILTLMEREPVYVDKMTAEVRAIFRENPDSLLLFWILSFLEEEYYNSSALKLKAIGRWVNSGCTSPYLYLEAYYLLCQDPYLLTKLDRFEVRLLRWAARYNALNPEIAEQIFQIIGYKKEFRTDFYVLLSAAYLAAPTPEHLSAVIGYLIRTDSYHTKFHEWYVKGIEQELRITGLYEAYLLSMDERDIFEIPKMIQMYFRYESSVPYKQLAVLYNNIIVAKDTDPDTYQRYRNHMGRFAMEQVEAGHMDDNLAILYEDMLDLGLVNEELAHALSKIVFANKLIVFENNMVRAIIFQREQKDPQVVPIRDNTAYFQLYSDDFTVLFEDASGRRYAGGVSYRLEPLMNLSGDIEKCMLLASDEVPYAVYRFRKRRSHLLFQREDRPFFHKILFGNEFSADFLNVMVPEILRYCMEIGSDTVVREFLSSVQVSDFNPSVRKILAEQLVEHQMYDSALDVVREYGIDQLSVDAQTQLMDHMVIAENENEDEFLIRASIDVFCDGKYTDAILSYLCRFYTGPSVVMLRLWKVACTYQIDTYELEEKILTQCIYSGRLDEQVEEVFQHYSASGGSELVEMAYISYLSYQYFVKMQSLSDAVFESLLKRYFNGTQLNDACRLALLYRLSGLTDLTEEQYNAEDELVALYVDRNMYFSFFKKLDKRIVEKYHFDDRVFIEYRTTPHARVILNYSFNEGKSEVFSEDMAEVYEGIFVKSFILFFGERIRYYIAEEKKSIVEMSESNELLNNDVYGDDQISRYQLLNQMVISATLQEDKSLIKDLKNYYGYETVSRQAFHIL